MGTVPGELDLFALVILLRRNLLRIFLFAVCAFLAMVAYTLLVKPRFSATASLLIPSAAPSAATLALQATGLDLTGGGYEVYLDILKSQIVADRMIGQYDLKNHYRVKDEPTAEKVLGSLTEVTAAKEGLVRVTVTDEDPKLAADLANGYLENLDWVNRNLAITAAGQRRKYFEQEMVKEKDALADAEVALQQGQEKTGVIEPELQVRASVEATETTRAQLRARQIELTALQQGATAQNPEVERLRAEISGLESQLHAEETVGGEAGGAPMAKVPERTLVFVRRERDVKFHEALFELLARQYETAKEQEAKDISMIQILDSAKVPEHKSWPPRTLYCLMAFFAGALLGVVYTIAATFLRSVSSNPENMARYRALRDGKLSDATTTSAV